MTTRRERKLLEAQQKTENGARAARRRLIRRAGGAFAFALAAVGAVSIGRWAAHRGDGGRSPASAVPPEVEKQAKDAGKKKTVEELQAELAEKEAKNKKTKEWIWAEEGHTELLIAAYREKLTIKGSAAKEERVRLLSILGRTSKPRAEWPAAFNDEKARQMIELFTEILRGEHTPGGEPTMAVQSLATFALVNPDFRGRADEELQAYYASDTRPAPRGETLMALARIGSAAGVALCAKAAEVSEGEVARSALYALSTYLDQPAAEKAAVQALRSAATQRVELRALAVKLLANHGSREIASLVPTVLRKGASPRRSRRAPSPPATSSSRICGPCSSSASRTRRTLS